MGSNQYKTQIDQLNIAFNKNMNALKNTLITLINNGMNVIGVDPFIQGIVIGIILIIFVTINLDRRKIPVLK